MNEKQKKYIIENWEKYDIVNSQDEMIKLINILEAHKENLDTFHRAAGKFCGVYGDFCNDRASVQILFNSNCFYNNEEELYKVCIEEAELNELNLDDYMKFQDIRKTSDGVVRVLLC